MIHRFDVALSHGITLSCRANQAAGRRSGAPRVLMLHGFPEAAFVWDEVIERLGHEVDALAPNLRGFERSSAPSDAKAYRAKPLLEDLVALIESFGGAPLDALVAHDWGGALAWALAAQRPSLMRRLVIVNAPHPATFLRELLHSPQQQAASAYMNFLCRPDAAALLAENDFARLWPFFGEPGREPAWRDEATKAKYREVWGMGLEGGLNYYRASPLRPPTGADAPIHRVQLAPEDVRVTVPTSVVWGERDVALPPALLDGLEAYVPTLDVLRVPEGTHWIVHEQPELIARVIRRAVAP